MDIYMIYIGIYDICVYVSKLIKFYIEIYTTVFLLQENLSNRDQIFLPILKT